MRTRAAQLTVTVVVAAAALLACTQSAAPVSAQPPRAWAPVEQPDPADADTAYVAARLAEMSVRELAASVIMTRVPSTDPATAREAIAASGIGGVILMGGDTKGSVQTSAALAGALAADPGLPPLTAVDQEGGIVARLPDGGPSAAALAGMPPAAAEAAFAERARLVAAGGFTVNFGVVADVTADARSFLAPRVFGGDPSSVAERVAAAVAGERDVVLSTLKHFPGHGAAPGDSHALIPTAGMGLDEWRAGHAPPFEAGIAAGAELVMMGHLRFPAVDPAPATLAPEWYRVLREELGFDGVAVTDDLWMLTASGEPAYEDPYADGVAALAAGADLLLYVGPIDTAALVDRIDRAVIVDGTIPLMRLEEAARRVLELRRSVATSDAPYVRCTGACLDALS
ncbi:MAG: glycoside hydrolase family 3 protein [Microbacteriaceae bacterium]|nr:MAG: glycoside hydrolase family 3 protein [Microbacteriaceae bacterium]